MGVTGRAADISLDPPMVKHADVVPAVEDRTYVLFIGTALVAAVAGGFALAILLSLAESGLFLETRVPWLIQAHGWAQLQGWAGLFVAGMGLRLLPRFAGRRPLTRRVNLTVFALLLSGVVVRTVAQPGAGNGFSIAGLLAGQLLWSAGAAVFAGVVFFTLIRGRAKREPWRAFAFAGAGWWFAWSAAGVAAGVRGASNDAFVPNSIDDPMTWMVLLGAIGNFIWAVQSRAVPIFFGRKPPSVERVALPALFLNLGVGLIFAAAWLDDGSTHERLVGAGFVLCGVALAWLAPVAGSCWGRATRLRPRARAASRFVLLANLAAVTCGLLLVWAGARTLADGQFAAPGVRDGARHAFGAGVVTLLIVGMAQLVAPFFALQRVESRSALLLDHAVFWLLGSAAVLRIASALLLGHMAFDSRMHLSALAGSLAWLGLVLFAVMAVRAVRAGPRVKATLEAIAVASANRGTQGKTRAGRGGGPGG